MQARNKKNDQRDQLSSNSFAFGLVWLYVVWSDNKKLAKVWRFQWYFLCSTRFHRHPFVFIGTVRLKAELDLPCNAGLSKAILMLGRIKQVVEYVSWADLIQMAGALAVEESGGPIIDMIYGREDCPEHLYTHRASTLSKKTVSTHWHPLAAWWLAALSHCSVPRCFSNCRCSSPEYFLSHGIHKQRDSGALWCPHLRYRLTPPHDKTNPCVFCVIPDDNRTGIFWADWCVFPLLRGVGQHAIHKTNLSCQGRQMGMVICMNYKMIKCNHSDETSIVSIQLMGCIG